MTGKTNLAASVAARLLNRAKQAGDDYQIVLTSQGPASTWPPGGPWSAAGRADG